MAKRFTDTDIWKKQRWFRKLTPEEKLVFYYIKDQCHHSGIWKIDCSDLIEDLGIDSFNMEEFINSINTDYDKFTGNKVLKSRIIIIKETNLWITGFIQFQYENKEGKVPTDGAPVRTALQYLQGLGILKMAIEKGYITLTKDLPKGYYDSDKGIDENSKVLNDKGQPLRNPPIRAKDKDKEKDKDILLSNSNKVKIGEKDEKKQYKQFRSSASQGADLYVERIKRGMEEMRKRNGNENIENEGG